MTKKVLFEVRERSADPAFQVIEDDNGQIQTHYGATYNSEADVMVGVKVTSTGTLMGPDGAILATDENGNIIANVNLRTGYLSDLLSLAGGAGEISVATDLSALVRHNGVINGAVAFYPSEVRSITTFAKPSQSITGGAAEAVVTLTAPSTSSTQINGLTLDDATDYFYGVDPNKGYEILITFTANLPVTAKWKFLFQQEVVAGGGSFTSIGGTYYLQGKGINSTDSIVLRRMTLLTGITKAMRLVVSHDDGTNVVAFSGTVQVRVLV